MRNYLPLNYGSELHLEVRAKTDWLRVKIMNLGGTTCLPVDWFFSMSQQYKNQTEVIDPVQKRHCNYLIKK
jgi:hypothetical protein